MLQIVNHKKSRFAVQKTLEKRLKTDLPRIGKRKLGFQGGNETMDLYSRGDGKLFFSSYKTDGRKGIERYWNAFGFFDAKLSDQDIAVEINIAVESTSRQVAAFFARDSITGRDYLFHSGKIGGGYKGVGQYAFLAWCKKRLVAVYDQTGCFARLGVLVCALDEEDLTARIERFVTKVANFKRAVRQEEINKDEIFEITKDIDRYSAEFSGRKRGLRASLEIDYVSVHGDIVDALMEYRSQMGKESEIIGNTSLIDLYVKKQGSFSEIYEIKPHSNRYSIYTAIGQLLVHGNIAESPDLYLVVPEGEEIHNDIGRALADLGIIVMYYSCDAAGKYRFSLR